ncbi:MAG: hypothetical protein QXN26_04635 [Thermoplasmataceae archaeon]
MTEDNIRSNRLSRAGMAAFLVPFAALAAAYLSGSILALDYVHVLLGAIWTGIDIFLGLLFSTVMGKSPVETRKNVAARLLPMTLFFIPAVSVVVPLAGYLLALNEGIFTLSTWLFRAIVIIGILLVGTGFATIVPFSIRIAGVISGKRAGDRLPFYLKAISTGALVQMVLQIAIISLMAYIVVYM